MTSTVALDNTHFFTTLDSFVDATVGVEHAEVLGVLWHVEPRK